MTIICGHSLTELRKLPGESVDLCLTGPPFYRCEDWGNKPQIWDIYAHQRDCDEHNFVIAEPMTMIVNQSAVVHYGQRVHYVRDGKFCSKCNVWCGNLGLEPTIDLYVKHMTTIFNEVKRVLKNNGACWTVMGDTYDYPGQSLLMIPERLATSMIDEGGWILRSKIISNNQRCLTSSATQRAMTSYWTVYFFTKSLYHPHPKYYSPLANDNDELNGLGLIRFHCPENGIVLDPFCGQGRVALAATLTNRRFIGIELNKERARYAEERVRKTLGN